MKVGYKVIWKEKGRKRTGTIFGYGAPGIVLVASWDSGYAEIVSLSVARLTKLDLHVKMC